MWYFLPGRDRIWYKSCWAGRKSTPDSRYGFSFRQKTGTFRHDFVNFSLNIGVVACFTLANQCTQFDGIAKPGPHHTIPFKQNVILAPSREVSRNFYLFNSQRDQVDRFPVYLLSILIGRSGIGRPLQGVIERDVVIKIDQSQKVPSLHNFRSTGVEEIIFFISLRFDQFIIEKVVETLFPDWDPMSL